MGRVTEFGARYGVSTTALLAGQPERLTTYDLIIRQPVRNLAAVCGRTDFQYVQADVLAVNIECTDTLFIDTLHTATQLRAELERHAAKVGQWIVLHDTVTFGERGEDGGPGLMVALRAWLAEHPEWHIACHRTNNHGLTLLERDASIHHQSRLADDDTGPGRCGSSLGRRTDPGGL
jgi:hypothetical protein